MAPKKNKNRRQPKNAFYFFMLHFQQTRGQTVANLTKDEIAECASRAWEVK